MKNIVEQWNKAAQKYTEEQEQSEFAESNKQVVKKTLSRFIVAEGFGSGMRLWVLYRLLSKHRCRYIGC